MAIDWFKLLQKTGSMRRMDFFAEGVVSVFFLSFFTAFLPSKKQSQPKKITTPVFYPENQ